VYSVSAAMGFGLSCFGLVQYASSGPRVVRGISRELGRSKSWDGHCSTVPRRLADVPEDCASYCMIGGENKTMC